MILLDSDGVLNLDDLPEDGSLLAIFGVPAQLALPAAMGPRMALPVGANNDPLIGRPLAEVERFYMERALDLAEGNREEAARMLGIGERTLYRKLQEWKKESEG